MLRVDADGVARVTMPRWGRRSEAREFAESQVAWIERQRSCELQRPAKVLTLQPGALVLVRGEAHALEVSSGPGGLGLRVGDVSATFDGTAPIRKAVVEALKERARRELPARLHELAAMCGLAVGAVAIRDQRTRWGSCAASGRISLNWRLVQMPVDVRDYVLYHELMHLRVRNHSPRFWRQVAQVCPAYEDARRWLREQAGRLL